MAGLWEMILLKTLQNQVCERTLHYHKSVDIVAKVKRTLFKLSFFQMYPYEAAE